MYVPYIKKSTTQLAEMTGSDLHRILPAIWVNDFEARGFEHHQKMTIWSMSFHEVHDLHPGRLTWNLRIHPWKRKIIFQTIIFRFHVNLPGCIISFLVLQKFQISKPVSTQFQFKISKNIHKTKKQIWQHSPSYKKTKLHWRILRGVFYQGCVNHDWHAVIDQKKNDW